MSLVYMVLEFELRYLREIFGTKNSISKQTQFEVNIIKCMFHIEIKYIETT